jgi:PhzF family phenazine biosynthesis protein
MRIRIVDAFADRPFVGNPAGVCLLDGDGWPEGGWMRQVAAELNLPATAFARPSPAGGGADWALRWFSPVAELELCGHGTLATTHVLHRDHRAAGRVRYSTRSGVLSVQVASDGGITIDFPAAVPTEEAVPEGLAAALGAEPEATYGTGSLGDLLVVFDREEVVRGLAPDLDAVERIARRESIRGIVATASASAPPESTTSSYDFVSRFFAPALGLPEDPVTGSAHTALAPYWSDRLGRDDLAGHQASARTGLVRTAVRGDRVHVTGHAVTVLDGTLLPEKSQGRRC